MSGITGFYGGKFMPLHKGHLYCIDTAAKQCDRVVVIIFINSDAELEILKTHQEEDLKVENRIRRLARVCGLYENVEFHVIDDRYCRRPDDTEDWELEIPQVRAYVPHMDYVYSSEPSYDAFFRRAYPEAIHVIVDEKRIRYPISATMIRAMNTAEEKREWLA